jgi:hypothetical protein
MGGEKKLTKPGKDVKETQLPAWIIGIEGKRPAYDLQPLLSAQQVSLCHAFGLQAVANHL